MSKIVEKKKNVHKAKVIRLEKKKFLKLVFKIITWNLGVNVENFNISNILLKCVINSSYDF